MNPWLAGLAWPANPCILLYRAPVFLGFSFFWIFFHDDIKPDLPIFHNPPIFILGRICTNVHLAIINTLKANAKTKQRKAECQAEHVFNPLKESSLPIESIGKCQPQTLEKKSFCVVSG